MRDLTNDIVVQVNKNGISYLQFKVLLNLGVKHAYSLKNEDMNFRHSSGDFALEKESYRRLCNSVELDFENVTKPKQYHTDKVKAIDKVYTPEELGHIDGLITDKPGVVLATTNADCILYLLYDKRKKVIGNIHSGWRGSYQQIIEKAIDRMINTYKSNPEDIIVCVCPSIRRCCFEVDKDVRDMFYEKFSFIGDIDKFIVNGYKNNKFFVDTVGINNQLLINKGIWKTHIYDCGICSVCNKDLVHSYRAEGKSFKLASAIIGLE